MTQPTEEILPSGEKALVYSDRTVLKPRNSLGGLLNSQHEEAVAASEAMREALVQAAVDKRESQEGGNTVPAEKRVV